MEHPAEITTPVRQWKTAALVAAALAAVELAVLVVLVVVYVAKPVAARLQTRAEAAAAAAPAPEQTTTNRAVAHLARGETSVLVLNGNGIAGAAARAASVLQGLHYVISATGNAPRSNFKRSLVMYRHAFEGEARRLAKDLRIKRVAPLDGMRASDLQGAHLALILGGNAGR